ncbi:MAG: Eco57I restriction-modification methylase domain-containing protein [Scardovia wiggsiae]
MIKTVAKIRDDSVALLSPERQQQLGQFLTPMSVAEQAASLFTHTKYPSRILDLGSGTGILAAAVAMNSAENSTVLAIEQDSNLAVKSEETLKKVCSNSTVINKSIFDINTLAQFDKVILNPPYKKVSPYNIATATGNVKVTNAYTAFLVNAVQSLMPGGECVAIIPRSWMNGDYFKDFRKWLTNECSIDTIAIYGSRQEHFKDMKILQEIMLLKLSKRQQAESIRIYNDVSPYAALKSQTSDRVLFKDLVLGQEKIIRIHDQDSRLTRFKTISEQGLWVSTGKLVWFRNRDILFEHEQTNGYPLYWSANQHGVVTTHPAVSDKKQWMSSSAEERNVLLPPGSYCLINRFSSKEQHHRIYASYLRSRTCFAAENKLNYVHQGSSRHTIPLDDKVAQGLTIWLSSTIIDSWYRQLSGSTQVNATDLRYLPCPDLSDLISLTDKASIKYNLDQNQIDQTVEDFLT